MINNSSQQNQSKTLWIGDIESWMDEKFLLKVFSELTTVKNVKIMRDKNTGLTQGYGFVEFDSPEIARTIMTNLNGKSIAGTNKLFKLNWATHGAGKSNTYNNTVTNTALYNYQGNNNINGLQDYSIYVADIDPNVSEEILKEFFMKLYPSVISSKEIIVDPITKLSKGYGFIKFKDYNESQRAINEMNGKIFFSKPLKTNQAAWKKLTQENNTNNLNSNYSALFTTGNNNNYYQKSNINSKVYPQGYSGADPNTVYGGYDMNQVMMMYGQSNINNNAYQNYPINCSYQIQNTTPNLSTTSSNNNINTNQANNSININQYLQYQQQQMYLQSLYHQNYNNIPNTNTNNKMSGYNSNNNNLSTNSQILNPSNVNSTNNIPNLTNQQLLTYLSTVGNNSFSTGTNSLNTNTSSSTNSNQSSTQNTAKNEGSSTDNSKNVKNDKKEDKDEIKSEGSLSSPDSNSPTDNQLKNVGNINNNLDEKSLTTK